MSTLLAVWAASLYRPDGIFGILEMVAMKVAGVLIVPFIMLPIFIAITASGGRGIHGEILALGFIAGMITAGVEIMALLLLASNVKKGRLKTVFLIATASLILTYCMLFCIDWYWHSY